MERLSLDRALADGQPLVEIVVGFRSGVDYQKATTVFNSLGDDIELKAADWYNDPALRVGSATKHALERLFGFRITRVNLERFDDTSGTWGVWPDAYRWEIVEEAQRYPAAIAEFIEGIGISQPGADDDGQAWDHDRWGT